MILLAGLIPEIDIKIKTIGLRPGEKLYEELLNNKSKTVPTHNSKIMIANDISTDYDLLFTEVEELITFASYNNNNKLVAKMKEIVPEFVSMNSQYNRLDN